VTDPLDLDEATPVRRKAQRTGHLDAPGASLNLLEASNRQRLDDRPLAIVHQGTRLGDGGGDVGSRPASEQRDGEGNGPARHVRADVTSTRTAR
jgi:hypothetical protein